MDINQNKVRENRIRRAAQRQGLTLTKSRRRDARATDFGTFMLIDEQTNAVVASGSQYSYGMDLDAVEAFLS
jgi:hypothetical protein